MTSFTQPKKTPDGRYYVRPTEQVLVQLNGVKLATSYSESESVTLVLDESHQSKISAIDLSNLDASKVNCESWFQRQVADKTLEAAYTKSFSDGTMNVSKPMYAKVYRDKEVITGEDLTEGVHCDVVLEFSGIWFTKKAFGPSWKIVQTRVKSPPKKKYHEEYLFQDEDPVADGSDDDFV
jgi:hypothetical protein